VLVTEGKESEGEADVVIEIALGGEEREVLGENRGGEVLGGGFAVAAGEGDDEWVMPGAIGAGEVLQGEEGIGDLDNSAGDTLDGLADDECRSAGGGDLGGVVVGVETVAFEGDEDISLSDATGVGADLGDQTQTVSLKEAAAAEIGEGLEGEGAHGEGFLVLCSLFSVLGSQFF
jgi:hypothetical protein